MGAGGHCTQCCPWGWSRTCSTPQPWSWSWALVSRPGPLWDCSGRRVGLQVLVSVLGQPGPATGGQGSPRSAQCLGSTHRQPQHSGCPCLSRGTPQPSQPTASTGVTVQTSLGARRSCGASGPHRSSAQPGWGPVAFCLLAGTPWARTPWAGTPWAGHGVDSGGRCWLPWNRPSARLQRTSAGLGNNKLQQGLLLMLKKTGAK